MSRTILWAGVLALMLAASPRAWAEADPIPKVQFTKYTLPNGLEVILIPDRTVPLVAVSVWYHVGGGDETPGKSGFAHLFEHMMFQGTKHTGEDVHFKILEEIGASNVNGTTNNGRTNYFEVVPSNHLETALWLESDRMGYMLETVTEKSLANQRDVVKNERRQRIDTAPYGKENMATYEQLYPEGHPYRYNVIGRFEDLTAASLDDVKGFFRTWYVPSNATLTLAGDFDEAEAKKAIDKWFAGFPKLPKPKRSAALAAPPKQPKQIVVKDEFARLKRVRYAWHTPKLYAPGDAELDLAAYALGDAGTGRLYRKLVLDKQLAARVTVYQESQDLSSAFHIIADLKEGSDVAAVKQIIEEEIGRLAKEPMSDKELGRGRLAMEVRFVWGLEPLLGRTETLQGYNHSFGDPDGFARDLNRYRQATAAGVQAAVAKYLAPNARVEVVTEPGAPAAAPAKGGAK